MASPTEPFKNALAQIESILENADEHSRHEISTALAKLARKSETPLNALYRIGVSVSSEPNHQQERKDGILTTVLIGSSKLNSAWSERQLI